MTTQSFRWRIVRHLARSRRTCITALVDWAQTDDRQERHEIHPLRHAFSVADCKADIERCGGCYCGRFRDVVSDEAESARVDALFLPPVDDPWADSTSTKEAS